MAVSSRLSKLSVPVVLRTNTSPRPAPAFIARADLPCRAVDPEVFYTPGAAAQAKAVCDSCRHRAECLEYALTIPPAVDWGIWGGTNVTQRAEIRRRRTGQESPS